ncbi:hypothetical protein DB30_05462 [Enhygromyxa salina]|uniref:Uncharacterized protein n=1 Tax=Enhygromyxa salina TaxID=215803 RepID=A0A0C1ZX02_9BACT|nr:hypothetical protein DB30_05462 [Enhygromyxa salina]
MPPLWGQSCRGHVFDDLLGRTGWGGQRQAGSGQHERSRETGQHRIELSKHDSSVANEWARPGNHR